MRMYLLIALAVVVAIPLATVIGVSYYLLFWLGRPLREDQE